MPNDRCFVLAEVNNVKDSAVTYPSCPQCYSKVYICSLECTRFYCAKCDVKLMDSEVMYRFRLNVVICDSRIEASVTVFGTCLEKYFGCTAGFLHRYLMQIEKEECITSKVNTESLLHDALQDVFTGRMLLFGFKVNPPKGTAFSETQTDDSNGTLEYVVKNNVCIYEELNCKGTSGRGYKHHDGQTWQAQKMLPTLIAYQTIDTTPNQELIPVIAIFKHKLASWVTKTVSRRDISAFEDHCIEPVSGIYTPKQYSSLAGNSTAVMSFNQPSLMLSCESQHTIDDLGYRHSFDNSCITGCLRKNTDGIPAKINKRTSDECLILDRSDNGYSNVTFSPVEKMRIGNLSSANQLSVPKLEDIDFDETIDPSSLISASQLDSIVGTQSQHLSQEDGPDYISPHLDSPDTNKLFNTSRLNKMPKSVESDNINTTDSDNSCDTSELLLAIKTDTINSPYKMECRDENFKVSGDRVSSVCGQSTKENYFNSFDEGDSELLCAIEKMNVTKENDTYTSIPDGKGCPSDLPQLPLSENLDSFLEGISAADHNMKSKKIITNTSGCSSNVEQEIFVHDEDVLPLCEPSVKAISQPGKHIQCLSSLPDSEGMETFLDITKDEDSKKLMDIENLSKVLPDTSSSHIVTHNFDKNKDTSTHATNGNKDDEISESCDIPCNSFSHCSDDLFSESDCGENERDANFNKRKSVHFASNLLECANISHIDKHMKLTPTTDIHLSGSNKSCLKITDRIPGLTFSPVISVDADRVQRYMSQSCLFTPSPEISRFVSSQVGNMSLHSTPLLTAKQNECINGEMSGSVCTLSTRFEDLQNEAEIDCLSFDLFSANSAELFSNIDSFPSPTKSQNGVNGDGFLPTENCGQGFLPNSTPAGMGEVYRTLKQKKLTGFGVAKECITETNVQKNSEDLFSGSSDMENSSEMEDFY